MARIRKENITTSFFHIMVQGNNKEYIFEGKEDINKYKQIMLQTKKKIDIMILAYCIMNNHAHILFHEQDVENLTKYMHRANLLYAQYYNKKYSRVGHVFRDRYKMQPIYNEKHLYTCVKYIHNNPVKANICKKPNEYPYSSCYKNIFYTGTELERNIQENMYMQVPELKEDDEFILLEEESNKEQTIIDKVKTIMMQNSITKEQLYHNEKIIGLIIKKLKNENKVSYRMIESILGINRKRLRKIEKEQEIEKEAD